MVYEIYVFFFIGRGIEETRNIERENNFSLLKYLQIYIYIYIFIYILHIYFFQIFLLFLIANLHIYKLFLFLFVKMLALQMYSYSFLRKKNRAQAGPLRVWSCYWDTLLARWLLRPWRASGEGGQVYVTK